MTKMKKGGVIAALCVAASIGGGFTVMNQMQSSPEPVIQTYVAEEERPEKEYTVMLYMIGSDLESEPDEVTGAGTSDLEEMLAVMMGEQSEIINKRVNLVAEAGGSYQWGMPELEGMQNVRFCINDGGIDDLKELRDTNMGESSALSDFINYAMGTYPAQNYILLFWNHGNGPIEGYGYDVLHEGDSILLSEMRTGIEQSELDTRLRLVGFDACLMGSIETAGVMSTYADYMVASAELEPQDGWDYTWLDIFAEENLTGEQIGKRIVDCYDAFYREETYPITLACMDLNAYQETEEAFSHYLELLFMEEEEDLYGMVSQKRKQVQGFGNSSMVTDCYDLVDMEQLLQDLSETAWTESGLEDSLDRLIPIRRTKGYGRVPCGISVYLPSATDFELEESIRRYRDTGFENTYIRFAADYAAYLLEGELPDLEGGMGQYGQQEERITAEFAPEFLQETAALYLLAVKPLPGMENCFYVLATDSDLSVSESGKAEAVTEETYTALKGQALCLVEQYNSPERTDYMSPVLYNGELCMMKISFSEENADGEITAVIPVTEEKISAKKEYKLQTGDTVTPLYMLFTDETTPMQEISVREDIYENLYYMGEELVMEEEWDTLLETTTVPFSDCFFGFMIEDNRQNFQYTELLQIDFEDQ